MIRATFALVFVLVAAPVFGQQLIRHVDLSAFGWGTIEATWVDIDANPDTEEWAVFSWDRGQWRVVSVRNGQFCAGPWFHVGPSYPFAPAARVMREGRVDVLRVTDPYTQTMDSFRLDVPTQCAP